MQWQCDGDAGPAHAAQSRQHDAAGADVNLLKDLSLGGELAFTGSQYFAGDDSNLNPKLPATIMVNLRAAWQVDERWQLFGLSTICSTIATLCMVLIRSFKPGCIGYPGPERSAHPDLRQPVSFSLG